jgi:hypothetical protein
MLCQEAVLEIYRHNEDHEHIYGFAPEKPERNKEALLKYADWVMDQYARSLGGLDTHWLQEIYIVNLDRASDSVKNTFRSTITPNHCGTVCCVAGKIVLDNSNGNIFDADGVPFEQSSRMAQFVGEPCYSPVFISEWAADFLGITEIEADYLFEGDNSAEFIYEFMHWLAEN